jgi:2-amino-4-hydroxy-6-hydroxymethyldihydropteridine diphosphokinase
VSHTAYIGVGSNIQDPCRNCIEAIRRVVDDERAELLAVSSLYLTSPVSPIPQQDFLNGALKIGWNGSPSELLTFLQGVEGQMGRKRTVPLGPRTIDLDILLFDDFVLDTPHLTIPHLKLHERKFALVPCLEIDPALVHPRLGRSLAELLSEAGEEQKIELFKSITIEV